MYVHVKYQDLSFTSLPARSGAASRWVPLDAPKPLRRILFSAFAGEMLREVDGLTSFPSYVMFGLRFFRQTPDGRKPFGNFMTSTSGDVFYGALQALAKGLSDREDINADRCFEHFLFGVFSGLSQEQFKFMQLCVRKGV